MREHAGPEAIFNSNLLGDLSFDVTLVFPQPLPLFHWHRSTTNFPIPAVQAPGYCILIRVFHDLDLVSYFAVLTFRIAVRSESGRQRAEKEWLCHLIWIPQLFWAMAFSNKQHTSARRHVYSSNSVTHYSSLPQAGPAPAQASLPSPPNNSHAPPINFIKKILHPPCHL
jgi:hypothetical protein